MSRSRYGTLVLTMIAVALLLLLLANTTKETIAMRYFPVFPAKGQPLSVKIGLRNQHSRPCRFKVAVHSNGIRMTESTVVISEGSVEQLEFVTLAEDLLGTSQRIHVEAHNLDIGSRHEATMTIPPYPPEIFSSFVSFASFSTTLMGYMATFAYYWKTMLPEEGLNVGLAVSFTLIGLLIFQELSDPTYASVGRRILELRRRYGRQVAILLAAFFSMVLTKVVLIIS